MEQLQTEIVGDVITYVDNQPVIIPQVHGQEEQILTFESIGGSPQSSRTHSMTDLGKRLLHAARCGDVDQVRQLMGNGAPFTTDWLGTSPLHFAAHSGHFGTAEALIRAGISRDAKTKVDRTPLHCACQEGHKRVAEVLLKTGADVDAKDMLRMAPIHWAVERNHRDIVELLLKHGADLSAEDKFDRTPIHIAVQNETMAIAHLLQNSQITMESALNTSSDEVYTDTNVVEAARNVSQSSTPLPIHHKRQKPARMRNNASRPYGGETSVLATLAALAEATSTPNAEKTNRSDDSYKWLENHGITMVQTDGGGDGDQGNGGVLTLTEAGKLALNLVKQQQQQHSGARRQEAVLPNYSITTDENGQNVITIMTEQPLETTSISTTSTSPLSAVTARKDYGEFIQPAKKEKSTDCDSA